MYLPNAVQRAQASLHAAARRAHTPRPPSAHVCQVFGLLVLVGLTAATSPGRAQDTDSTSPLEGTWESRAEKWLDQTVQFSLRATPDPERGPHAFGGQWRVAMEMELPLESWSETYCDGHDKLEQVVVYKVRGERKKSSIEFRFGSATIERCTCPAKCRIRDKSGTFEGILSADGQRLSWDDRVLFSTEVSAGATPESLAQITITGAWETGAEKAMDMTQRRLLEISEDTGGVISGSYTMETVRPLPLQSWRERYCDGLDDWRMIESWTLSGKRERDELALAFGEGRLVSCSCPTKCRPDSRGGKMTLRIGPDGKSLLDGDMVFKRQEPPVPSATQGSESPSPAP